MLSVSARMSGHPTPASSKRCIAIINPAGGNGRVKKMWDNLYLRVEQQLSSGGFCLEQRYTTGPGSAAQLASDAAAAGAEVVLAVGGDGTIHEVVSGLVRQTQQQQQQQEPTTALAVLPLGTGSDYARTFGWQPNDAEAACQRILSGEQQLTDVCAFRQVGAQQQPAAAAPGDGAAADVCGAVLGSSECRYIVNVASCGAGALSAAKAAALKQLGPLCYAVGGALTLWNWKGCTVQVSMDDSKTWQTLDNLTTLVLGQGQYWGGGMQILPDADPTDGLMDVVALQGLGLSDFVLKGHLLRMGQHLQVKGVNLLGKCKRIRVKAAEEGARLAWECDGEPQGQFEEVEISVVPKALKLLSGWSPVVKLQIRK